MMKRLATYFTLLLALLAVSCTFRQLEDPAGYPSADRAKLDVRVFIPGSVSTRAETGMVDADRDAENMVNKLQIWVFKHSDASLIGYIEPSMNSLHTGSQETYSIFLEETIAEEAESASGLYVDVYVLANGESAGLDGLGRTTSRSALEAATMSGSVFGIDPLTISVPATGLPMSAMTSNVRVGVNSSLSFSVPDVLTLKRAVSKLRFVFSIVADTSSGSPVPVNDFAITEITLNGGAISSSETVFTTADCAVDGNYEASAISYPVPSTAQIAKAENSMAYLYDGQTPQEYEDLIDSGIASGSITEWRRTYFRETDRQLSGTIRYTAGGVVKSVAFTMDAAGDFKRNHSWIIYVCFVGGQLKVQPTVLPWNAAHDRYVFNTEGYTELGYEKPWLRYDIDKEAWTWNDTWLVVAYGYEGGSVGKPTHSPMFTLETINSNELVLQLNNDQFIFVQMTQSVDSGNNPVYTYTKLEQRLEIHPSQSKQTNNFYVVPVNDNVMADPYVKVFLTELHGAGQPPTNIPFNHNLPGDEDHTSILIYNPGRAEYNDNINNHKNTSSNVQTTQYWLEEEG